MSRNSNPKRRETGSESAGLTKAEVERFSSAPNLVRCEHQPGNLRISPYACARRYMLAHNRNRPFYAISPWSLMTCGRCQEGRRRADAFRKGTTQNPNSGLSLGT